MAQQRKRAEILKVKESFVRVGKLLIAQGGMRSVWTGTPGTMARDGLFASFFLVVMPVFKDFLRPYVINDSATSLLAGTSSGILATVLSHGFDTVKSAQQARLASQSTLSFLEVAKKISLEEGFSGFTKGIVPRGTRVVCAVTIIGEVTQRMSHFYKTQGLGGLHP